MGLAVARQMLDPPPGVDSRDTGGHGATAEQRISGRLTDRPHSGGGISVRRRAP